MYARTGPGPSIRAWAKRSTPASGSGPPSPAPTTIVSVRSVVRACIRSQNKAVDEDKRLRTLIHPRLLIYRLKPVSKYVRTVPTYALCTSLATLGACRCRKTNSGRYFKKTDVCRTLRLVVMLVRIGFNSARKCTRSFVAACRS